MNDEHKPESTCGDGWLELEDGFTSSRRAGLTGRTYDTCYASMPSAVLARMVLMHDRSFGLEIIEKVRAHTDGQARPE